MAEVKLNFDDINVGDEAPVKTHTLTRTDLVRYAGASGDFNPMHHDEVKAQAAGQPSVFGHGMFSMGFLATAITEWVGIGNLRQFGVRFVSQSWPDDEFRTRIVVTDKRKEEGENLLDLEVQLLQQDDREIVSGTAIAAVPSA